MKESEKWVEFSERYDDKVFSLTKIRRRRKQILKKVMPGAILNLGTGPTSYLNQALVGYGSVIATDFCQEMLDVAQKGFPHPDLEYKLADSKELPFKNKSFDSVISVNSILPQTRKEVIMMFSEIYRVLDDDCIFISFLPSYDYARESGIKVQMDDSQSRVMDTTGWQCFHTPETIKEEMEKSGFKRYNLKKVFLKTKQEIDEFKRLYDVDTSNSHAYEYLLTTKK